VALSQDRASDVLRVAAKLYPKRLYLEVEPGRTEPNWSFGRYAKRRSYFREVFGRELFPTLA